MITEQQAIEEARKKVEKLKYVDSQKVSNVELITREYAKKMGATAEIKDNWSVSFDRVRTDHPLNDLFDFLIVSVDAETGEATIIESL